jgi:dual oxidase
LAYIYACVFLCFVPILCSGAAYGVVKLQNGRRRKLKLRQEEHDQGKSVDKMAVKEWLHQNHKRVVKLKFGPEQNIFTVNRKGEKLRKADFSGVDAVTVEETADTRKKPMVLIRVSEHYLSNHTSFFL